MLSEGLRARSGNSGDAARVSFSRDRSGWWRRCRASIAILAAVVGLGCGRVETLATEPPVTPEQWCAARPCIDLGGTVLDEPLGTLLVFALAGLWVAGGLHAWRIRTGQRSRAWFAVALVCGGIGAALAGTSFQAFGYELECAGRSVCVWTNWFEVGYLIAQAISVSGMVAAVAHARASGNRRLAIGAIGAWRRDDALGRSLVVATLWLVLTFVAYYAYAAAGMTRTLWDDGAGFYFSENDVLHVGMIGWLAYAGTVVVRRLRDT